MTKGSAQPEPTSSPRYKAHNPPTAYNLPKNSPKTKKLDPTPPGNATQVNRSLDAFFTNQQPGPKSSNSPSRPTGSVDALIHELSRNLDDNHDAPPPLPDEPDAQPAGSLLSCQEAGLDEFRRMETLAAMEGTGQVCIHVLSWHTVIIFIITMAGSSYRCRTGRGIISLSVLYTAAWGTEDNEGTETYSTERTSSRVRSA